MISDAVKQGYVFYQAIVEMTSSDQPKNTLSFLDCMDAISKRKFGDDTYVFYPTAITTLFEEASDNRNITYDIQGNVTGLTSSGQQIKTSYECILKDARPLQAN